MRVGVGTIDSDPRMSSGEDYYILHYKGKNIEVLMFDNRKEGSTKFSDNPFRIRWDILSIKPESSDVVSTQEIVDVITEAMIAHADKDLAGFVSNFDVQVTYTVEAH